MFMTQLNQQRIIWLGFQPTRFSGFIEAVAAIIDLTMATAMPEVKGEN
ncbi:MAG: hypothetical protein WC551_08910 [Patescibacteria group bacterium]